MTLSIVILTHNQSGHTLRCLDSLAPYLAANTDTDVVVVDNGSTDRTDAAIKRWCDEHGDIAARVRLIVLPENLGVAAGRNVGLNACRGDLLMILDNDTIVNAEAIDGMRQHLHDNQYCGVCGPALKSPEGELQASAKPYPGIRLKLAHVLHPGRELPEEREELTKPHPWYIIGACQMMFRTTYQHIGPLDENIFYGPEDADFCARVRRSRLTVDYLPHLEIIHDWRRATRRRPFSRLSFLHLRGLIHFWLKNYPS